VSTSKDDLSRKFFLGMASPVTNSASCLDHIILTCCSSVTDRSCKGQNTGAKGLAWKIEGPVEKIPTTLYG